MHLPLLPTRWRRPVLTTALLIVLAVVWYFFSLQILLEVLGGVREDAYIFRTMGQAMRNGIPFYTDVYETKPPGIYLLWAAALGISRGFWPMMLLSVFCQAGTLALWLRWAYRIARRYRRPTRIEILAGTLLLSSLAFYASRQANAGQVELFALFPITLSLYTLFADPRRPSILRMAIAGVALGWALFIREPFLFSFTAAALLLSESASDFLRRTVPTLAIAALTFFALLFATGTLQSYFTIYLPVILGSHVNWVGPTWLRWFSWHRVIPNIILHSPGLLIGLGTLVVTQWYRTTLAPSIRRQWLPLLLCIVGADVISNAFPLTDPVVEVLARFTIAACLLYIAGQCLGGILLHSPEARADWWARGSLLGALTCAMTAVSFGGDYFDHHFALPQPLYVALFLSAIPVLVGRYTVATARLRVVLGIGLLLLWLPLQHRWPAMQAVLDVQLPVRARNVEVAGIIDTVLDRCRWDRYQYIGQHLASPMSLTRHSPYGPNFFQMHYQFYVPGTPYFLGPLRRRLTQEAQVVLVEKIYHAHQEARIPEDLATYFWANPPACAGEVPRTDPYLLLFRKP